MSISISKGLMAELAVYNLNKRNSNRQPLFKGFSEGYQGVADETWEVALVNMDWIGSVGFSFGKSVEDQWRVGVKHPRHLQELVAGLHLKDQAGF